MSDSSKIEYKFVQNKKCEYFPCHPLIFDIEDFNCLFCFCPLYHLSNCGGDCTMLQNGKKDCSDCTVPHKRENYNKIIESLSND